MDRLLVVSRHCTLTPTQASLEASKTSAAAPHVNVYPPNRKHFVTNPWETLKRYEGSGGVSPAVTVTKCFEEKVARHGNLPAMAQKRGARDGPWTRWTWKQYYDDCRVVSKALMALGCEQHTAINILGFNSPEWFECAMGGIQAGLTPAGIYITNGPDGIEYILSHSKASVIFVDSDPQMQKVLSIRDKCPNLKHIVHWGADCPARQAGVMSWKDFMAHGAKVSDEQLNKRIEAMGPDNACYLSYTSGTTGNPKAVMYSHDNITWCFRRLFKIMSTSAGGFSQKEREVSYMPLSHIAGNVQLLGGVCMPDDANSEVYFAFPDAMQGSLPDTIREVRPTHFVGVPRVWEKFYAGLGHLLKAKPELKSNPTAVKAFLGLEQIRFATTGAAPIAEDVMRFFDSIELPLYEIYGMTENTAYSHYNFKGKRRIGSVGPQLVDEGAGAKVDKESGEIRTWSRAVMMGYMYMPEKTKDTFDDEGFLRTGDVGVERDGFTFITGRIKEMIITAGGENMAPVLLEAAIKERLPALSNVVMIGDRQKYLIALMTVKLEPDGRGGFTNKLDPNAQVVDPACSTFEDVQKSKIWATYVAQGIEDSNKMAISRAQHTRKYILLSGDFSPVGESCELTPTMKLKRDVVAKKFLHEIKRCYGEDYMETPQVPT
eukprot:TRINITY_DN32372_c0_g1_i1.p1 TRINITY_DN32372_c0_g1~~TRINITY_DN32372_c0_g1_i1.p1  ORF type:complete len:658 (+),score=116.86 TRINITY_DN32372_c0_g1_i1:51-2024(+)